MSDVACPSCRGIMNRPDHLAGKWVACPFCHEQFVLPSQAMIAAPPPGWTAAPMQRPGYTSSGGDWLAGVRVPILISGIFNGILAAIWALTCFGLVLTVPLTILAVYETSFYSKAPYMLPRRAISNGRTLGILEIVAGVFSLNVVGVTCGILALVMAGQAEQKLEPGRY